MTREEIAANIVIAMIQNPNFKPYMPAGDRPQVFTEAVCEAYKLVYQAIQESSKI